MKIWNYVFSAITMMLILQFAGIGTPMGSIFSDLFGVQFNTDNTLNQTDITGGNLYNFMFSSTTGFLLLIGLGGAVVAGLLALTGRSDIAIKASFAASILFLFVSSLYFAINYGLTVGISGWATSILGVIFIPYTIGFIIAIVEFVAGGTSD